MKRFFYVPCLLAIACTLLSSCLKNSDAEITLYDDAAITTFTLGTLKQTNPLTGTTTTLTGSVYKMGIDQINYTIYNRDSLPAGTKVDSVVVTVAAKNSGGIAIKLLNDTLFEWYSSTAAIDFSSPRIFRVFATDGSYYRDYQVTLNMKKGTESASWTTRADSTLFGDFSHARMLAVDTALVVLGGVTDSTRLCVSRNQGLTWVKEPLDFKLDADAWKNAVVCDRSVYLLSNQRLYIWKEMKEWESIANEWNLQQLVAADSEELFAITNDHLLKSTRIDNLNGWTAEQIDNSLTTDSIQKLLTLQDIASVSFSYSPLPNTDYVLLVGNDGTNTVVWRKISQYQNTGNTGKWVNIPAEEINYNLLPKQSPLSLVYFDSKVLAMGTNTSVYQSVDQGIAWRANTNYTLPIAMMSVTIDKNGVQWGISVNEGIGKIWWGMIF